MIIVSQDKTRVTNFNNVNTLSATKEGKILSFDNSYKSEDDYSDILGDYKTEERAKEVLGEIIDKYKEYATISNVTGNDIRGIYNIPKVYEMPKE